MPLPHPTPRPGLMRIPAPAAGAVEIRFARLEDRDVFDPPTWRHESMTAAPGFSGWWEVDLEALTLPDGAWEYEFVLDGHDNAPIADPWAEEITRFGGYRGVFRTAASTCIRPTFRWTNEIPPGTQLPENNQIVIYEMPVRWMSGRDDRAARQVDLATFDEVLFEHLRDLQDLGVKCN